MLLTAHHQVTSVVAHPLLEGAQSRGVARYNGEAFTTCGVTRVIGTSISSIRVISIAWSRVIRLAEAGVPGVSPGFSAASFGRRGRPRSSSWSGSCLPQLVAVGGRNRVIAWRLTSRAPPFGSYFRRAPYARRPSGCRPAQLHTALPPLASVLHSALASSVDSAAVTPSWTAAELTTAAVASRALAMHDSLHSEGRRLHLLQGSP